MPVQIFQALTRKKNYDFGFEKIVQKIQNYPLRVSSRLLVFVMQSIWKTVNALHFLKYSLWNSHED